MTVNANLPIAASLSSRSGASNTSMKDNAGAASFDDVLQGRKDDSPAAKKTNHKHATSDTSLHSNEQSTNAEDGETSGNTAHVSGHSKDATENSSRNQSGTDTDHDGSAKTRKHAPNADRAMPEHGLLPMLIKLASIDKTPAMNGHDKATVDPTDPALLNTKYASQANEEALLALTDLTTEKADSTPPTVLADDLHKKIMGQDKAESRTSASRANQSDLAPVSQPRLNGDSKIPGLQLDDPQSETADLNEAVTKGKNDSNNRSDRQILHNERVTVVAQQSFPAPAAHMQNPTSANLVSALASDIGSNQALAGSGAPPATPHIVATATHMLKIELHPAELGVVNVSMWLNDSQLSIEIRPENQEAHRRLSSDTETITRSLRDLGFDVGKVTVLQPSVAVAASARPDAGSFTNTSYGRDQQSFQSGNSGGQGDGSSGQQSGRNRNNDGETSRHNVASVRNFTRSDLFI